MIENGGEDCCVIVYVIIWAIMLAKVWKSMIRYIGEGGTDWFESEVVLRL